MDITGVLKAVSIGASIIIPEAGPAINLINQVITALRANGAQIPDDLVASEHEINRGVISLDVDTVAGIQAWRAAHPVPTPAPAQVAAPNP